MERQIGPYLVERELGRGGMGVVYLARHAELGRAVALKLLLTTDSELIRARFLREGEALARVRHPGVVGVHEAGEDAGRPYLALELVEGQSLQRLIDRGGPFDPRRAAELTLSMAEAMAHVHGLGILHRDLKPENVLLDGQDRPRITDFGLARDEQARALTRTGALLGTPNFMAPEQAAGEPVGAAADVYGLGATLYALLTGHPPFEGPSSVKVVTAVLTRPPAPPTSLRPELDRQLEAICLRCLEKQPAARYADAAGLADVLRRWLAGESGVETIRRRGRAPLIAAALLLVVLGAGLTAALLSRAPDVPLASSTGEAPASERPGPEDEARSARVLATQRLSEARALASYDPDRRPTAGVLARLLRRRALQAWIGEHGPQAEPAQLREVQAELDGWGGDRPAVLAVLEPAARGPGGAQRLQLAFLPGPGLVLVGLGGDARLHVWDLAGPEPRAQSLAIPDKIALDAQRQPGAPQIVGDAVWVAGRRGLLRHALTDLAEGSGAWKVASVPDCEPVFVTAARGALAAVVRLPSREWGFQLLPGPASAVAIGDPQVQGVASSADGQWLAVCGGDTGGSGFARAWDLRAGAPREVRLTDTGPERKRVALTADGACLAVGGNNGPLELYRPGAPELAPVRLDCTPGWGVQTGLAVGVQTQALLFAPDGRRLVSCVDLYGNTPRGELAVWDWVAALAGVGDGAIGTPLARLELDAKPVSLASSPDGDLLALSLDDGRVWLLPGLR